MDWLDPALWIEHLGTYWGSAVLLAGFFFAMTVLGVRMLDKSIRETIALRLMGVEQENWCASFCALFDGCFGRNHLSLHCVIRSAIASVFAVSILWVIFGAQESLGTRASDVLPFWQVVLIALAINVVADYISLLETRWLLSQVHRLRSTLGQIGVLIIDALITGAIVYAVIYLYQMTPLYDGDRLTPGEIFGVFSVFGLFFYSTFLTSVWIWLYILSSWVIRLFTRLRLGEVLDMEETLPWILASVLALVTGAGTLMASVPLTRDEVTGTNMVEDALCQVFGGETCHALARLTPDQALQAELVLQGCATGAAERCLQDGLARLEIAPEDAAAFWDAACQGGNALGCTNLGVLYRHGTGVAADAARAAELYAQGCEGGEALGCTNLGFLYQHGTGVAVDAARAAELYAQGCEGGNALGCTNLGFLYERGTGVAADAARAAALYAQGCEGGHAGGCSNLGVLYRHGTGVAVDAARAAELYAQGCEGGNARGCTNLGFLYQQGTGVAADAVRAAELYAQGCEGGDAGGCFNLGAMAYNQSPADRVTARAWFEEACARDASHQACGWMERVTREIEAEAAD